MTNKQNFTEEDLAGITSLKEALNEATDYQIGRYVPKEGMIFSRVWQKDGLYEVRENKLGTFVIKLTSGNFGELEGDLKEGIILKIPKLPLSIFDDIHRWFKFMFNKMKTEVYVRVYYSVETGEFYYVVPTQYVKEAKADWRIGDNEHLERTPGDILVMQAHSHHNYSGHFSPTDDEDQVTLEGVHLVIGRIFNTAPEYELRFALGKKKVNLKLEDIFDFTDKEEIDLSKFPGWDTNIHPSSELPENKNNNAAAIENKKGKRSRNKQAEAYVPSENKFIPMTMDEITEENQLLSEIY